MQRQVTNLQAHGLFVQQDIYIIVAELLLALDTRRNYIRDRCTCAVLFNIYSCQVKGGYTVGWNRDVLTRNGIQFIIKNTPLIADQLHGCKTAYNRIRKPGKKHSHKTDRFEIREGHTYFF